MGNQTGRTRDLDMRSAELSVSPFADLAERCRRTLAGDLLAFPHQGRGLLIGQPGGDVVGPQKVGLTDYCELE
jgi:hypothetical protein